MGAIKTCIILLQAAVLLAVGWFTRPQPSDFRAFAHRHMAAKADGLLSPAEARIHADKLADQCIYRDRWLWIEVIKDGKIAYVGAAAHWFDRTAVDRGDMSNGADGPQFVRR